MSVQGETLVPQILAGFVVVLDGLFTDFTVVDASYLESPTGDWISVGWAPDEEDVIMAEREPASVPWLWFTEKFEFVNHLNVRSGISGDDNASLAAHRSAVFASFARITTALITDPTLGDVTGSSDWGVYLSRWKLRQTKDEDGFELGITFHIACSTVI